MSTAARAVADAAAAAAGVELVDLHHHAQMSEASQLLDTVWGRHADAGSILPPEALTALAHAGAQISAARQGDRLVAVTAAFLGRDDAGRTYLHSHVTGVLPAVEGRGIGRALKWYQRAWCLERGIERVRWTFDPLIRRNAVINLVVLGARVLRYEEDVYGRVPDARNAGAPTDRLVVEWELASPRVEAAAAGRTAEPDLDGLRRAGARVALDEDDDGAPVAHEVVGALRLVAIPHDIERVRASRPGLAAAWAQALRAALAPPLREGLRVTGFRRDGWYVLGGADDMVELKETR